MKHVSKNIIFICSQLSVDWELCFSKFFLHNTKSMEQQFPTSVIQNPLITRAIRFRNLCILDLYLETAFTRKIFDETRKTMRLCDLEKFHKRKAFLKISEEHNKK